MACHGRLQWGTSPLFMCSLTLGVLEPVLAAEACVEDVNQAHSSSHREGLIIYRS